VSSETADEILAELKKDLNDLTAAHAFAVYGLKQVSDRFKVLPTLPQNPDPMIYIGMGGPNLPESSQHASWRLSAAIEQVEKNGQVAMRLGHQWVMFLYSVWQHVYRPRMAAAHGRNVEAERYPLLGDLRCLRNDVIHHRGIATQGNTGRCEILKWFKPGERIILEAEHLDQFLRLFPWSDLRAGV
jgi:hypothetical protein